MLSFGLQTRSARLPKRGTSGFVQRGPANPARPGREQRYRVSQVCRGDPEVPRFEEQISVISDQIPVTRAQAAVGCMSYVPAFPPRIYRTHLVEVLSDPIGTLGRAAQKRLSGLQFGKNSGRHKSGSELPHSESFDFFGADAENEPTLCNNCKG